MGDGQRRQGLVEGNCSGGRDPMPAVVPLKKSKNKNVFHGTAKE
jgi:hypothetical protein